MRLKTIRIYTGKQYTISRMYIDDVYFCDVLEPPDRGLSSAMTYYEIMSRKVKGHTAIPRGTYFIDMKTVSPRFRNRKWAKPYGGRVPRLQGVRGFEGVLIHVGNTVEQTDGCLLVGKNKVKGKVLDSTATYKELFERLDAAQELITITIE